jgi:hypothetical protein
MMNRCKCQIVPASGEGEVSEKQYPLGGIAEDILRILEGEAVALSGREDGPLTAHYSSGLLVR